MGDNLPTGDVLKKLREGYGEKALTQQQVADAIGCTVKTYRSWEKGNDLPSTNYLLELADFYGVDCDYLLGRLVEKTHDLAYICSKTGLSERTATTFVEEPEIAEALGWLDRDELRNFTNALDNFRSEVFATIRFLDNNNPYEQYLTGVHRLRFETAIYKFQEKCRELIYNWCDMDAILKDLKHREDAYFAALAEEEAKRQQEIETAKQQPKLSVDELFENYMKMADELGEKRNG